MDWQAIWNSVSISAVMQIAILYFVIYAILKYAKGSRFGQVLMGVGLLAAVMIAFTFLFHFDVLSIIVRSLLVYLAISTVVIFQPEIRRVLGQVGAFGFLDKPKYAADGSATPEFIVQTIVALADRRIGALIAFERGISLRSYEATGVTTDAIISRELVRTIFTPPLPLHDGGVIVRDGRLAAAHCVFPVSNNPDLIVSGMRHRAAVGMSEDTDALVVVVSEETGAVSVAHNGRLVRYAADTARPALQRRITKVMGGGARDRSLIRMAYRPIQRLLAHTTKGGAK